MNRIDDLLALLGCCGTARHPLGSAQTARRRRGTAAVSNAG